MTPLHKNTETSPLITLMTLIYTDQKQFNWTILNL
jgi:hypothetical protein